jgi:hypothetical protein
VALKDKSTPTVVSGLTNIFDDLAALLDAAARISEQRAQEQCVEE